MSNFLSVPFSILINFPYKSVQYIELRYLELLLCRTIFSVLSVISGVVSHPLSRIFGRGLQLNHTVHFRHLAFLLTSLINPFGISNYAISNFYYAEQFSRSFQLFLGCFPSAISNIRMRFSNEPYCSFQAFEC